MIEVNRSNILQDYHQSAGSYRQPFSIRPNNQRREQAEVNIDAASPSYPVGHHHRTCMRIDHILLVLVSQDGECMLDELTTHNTLKLD